MASYHAVLEQKVANIKEKCCRDEVIRSKLIQEIRDPGTLAELKKMTSPSAETVLQVYQTRRVCVIVVYNLPSGFLIHFYPLSRIVSFVL